MEKSEFQLLRQRPLGRKQNKRNVTFENKVRERERSPIACYNVRHKLLGRFDHEQNFSKVLFILSKYAVIT